MRVGVEAIEEHGQDSSFSGRRGRDMPSSPRWLADSPICWHLVASLERSSDSLSCRAVRVQGHGGRGEWQKRSRSDTGVWAGSPLDRAPAVWRGGRTRGRSSHGRARGREWRSSLEGSTARRGFGRLCLRAGGDHQRGVGMRDRQRGPARSRRFERGVAGRSRAVRRRRPRTSRLSRPAHVGTRPCAAGRPACDGQASRWG